MKNILIIAYDFPPNGITSSKRPGVIAKYLLGHGWNPIILTKRWDASNCRVDASIVHDMPDSIVRYEICDDVSNNSLSEKLRNVVVRILFPYLHPYSYLEDGIQKIDKIACNHKIDLIWATAPPAVVLELAKRASEKLNAPWIADFRDVHQWQPSLKSKITLPLMLAHENTTLKSATCATAVSNGFAEIVAKRNGMTVYTVSHGYDADATEGPYPAGNDIFNIVYTGGLVLGNPDLRPLLDAIGNLIERNQIDKKDIRVEFFGGGNEKSIAKIFRNHKYAELIVNYGAVSRSDVIRRQRGAALLLLASHPGSPGWITSKMFEYIVAFRPVISIPKDNDCVDEMITKLNIGVSCDSAAEIEASLLAYYKQWKISGCTEYQGDRAGIGEFSYEKQTAKLIEVLDRCVERSDLSVAKPGQSLVRKEG